MEDKIYLVWDDTDADKDTEGYWAQYLCLEDAVNEHEGEEIFEAIPKSIGYFEIKTSVVKSKKKKD